MVVGWFSSKGLSIYECQDKCVIWFQERKTTDCTFKKFNALNHNVIVMAIFILYYQWGWKWYDLLIEYILSLLSVTILKAIHEIMPWKDVF